MDEHSSSAPAGQQASAGGPSNAQNAANQHLSKRRRGLSVVTPNACTECRKKRAKCDGQTPCGRCRTQKDVECIYEIPVRRSKEHLRTEIEQLRMQKRTSEHVFAALVQPEHWEEVLQRLRAGQSVETISDWLAGNPAPAPPGPMSAYGPDSAGGASLASMGGYVSSSQGTIGAMSLGLGGASPVTSQHHGLRHDLDHNSPWHLSSHSQSERSGSHPDLLHWAIPSHGARGPPQSRVGSWAADMNLDKEPDENHRYRGLDQVLAPLDSPHMDVPAGMWTNITNNDSLVHRLLALYFCWEYPTFASLSKEHFLKDLQHGRHRFCSPILVNALLALGCRFSTQPNTRANPDDPSSSGDHFFKESQRLLYLEDDHHQLTTIQALGIMSIREASCGRDSESWYYAGQSIRLAIEMGLHRIQAEDGDEDEVAVQSATFWGAFALDHAWSLATGSLPHTSCFPHLPLKPAIIGDIEASLWIPYTDDGAPLQRSCEQPSNVRSVYKCFCELSGLVHHSLYILHSPGRPLTARDLLGIYTQYLNWYDRIPGVLRLGHNFTPAVLFTHMYFQFAILLLFRPLIKLRILGSGVSPRDVCSQAADAVQGFCRSYSRLYTLQRTPSFVPYFVLTSSIMHLSIAATVANPPSRQMAGMPATKEPKLDAKVASSIKQGIADLTEMAPCHGFAEQALNILRYLARKWNIDVDSDQEETPGSSGDGDGDGDRGGVSPGTTAGDYRSKTQQELDQLVGTRTSGLNFFAPSVREEDFMCTWGSGTGSSASAGAIPELTSETLVQNPAPPGDAAVGMENPPFWPFPMQGRPMLPVGLALKEAGFELL